jgi:cytochrome c5
MPFLQTAITNDGAIIFTQSLPTMGSHEASQARDRPSTPPELETTLELLARARKGESAALDALFQRSCRLCVAGRAAGCPAMRAT